MCFIDFTSSLIFLTNKKERIFCKRWQFCLLNFACKNILKERDSQ